MKKEELVSVIFFGDGAADEGVLYESINFAVLKKLPVIFVYENNQYSVCSHVSTRQAGESIFHKIPPENLFCRTVNGNDVLQVYAEAKIAVDLARNDQKPSFIECKTYRMRGHAGAGSDVKLGYRTDEEIRKWEAQCPVAVFRSKLLSENMITEQEIADMEREINSEIETALLFAQESPLPDKNELSLYLFKE